MDKIKENSLYLVTINFDTFICFSEDVKKIIQKKDEDLMIEIYDVAGNYLLTPYTKDTKIKWQELYKFNDFIESLKEELEYNKSNK
jgi:hypothetical protein